MEVTTKMRIGDPVWLRGAKKGGEPFELGQVTNVQQNGARVTVADASGAERAFDAANADVFPANPAGSTAPDHCGLIHLNEPSILENSRARYASDDIYTYTGKILIALNPFANLSSIYSEETMAKYKDKDVGARGAEPHVYAMGEAAYKHVKRNKTPAAIIMSGESGAGKTETTKHIMRYLAWRSESVSKKAEGKLDTLADAILGTNPLLEAFGNAKTVRNNNSSRFGKMMRLHFEPSGAVAGAYIKTYLLEKSRAVAITDPERNYHIFYQLCAAGPAEDKGSLLASLKPTDLNMLNQSKCIELKGKSDAKDYAETVQAMDTLGIPKKEQSELFRVLSALLLLGNIKFTDDANDKAVFDEQLGKGDFCKAAEELLACGALSKNLTSKVMKGKEKPDGRRSIYTIAYSAKQAGAVRDAVVKSIYTHLFDWIVEKVNTFIAGNESTPSLPYVGLLDIFGFENFAHNSFEQLCINFANEKLQQFFLTQVFKEEEVLHVKEGVPWKEVEYQDNTPCIELMEKPPNGIFRLLDSQCKAPKASEEALCEQVNETHKKGGFLAPTRLKRMRDGEGFIVRHYAGDVVYETSTVIGKATKVSEVSLLEKNNDTLQEDWLEQLAGSEVPLLKSLFSPGWEAALKAKKSASFSSVGKRFVNDLNSLLDELKASKAHFVRCIKPNSKQVKKEFEPAMVLDQLRCSGVVEAVRVMTEAYPTRIPYEVIHGRYAPLMGKEVLDATGDEPAAFCEAIAIACDVAPGDFALGLTKLFLKVGCGVFLEDLASMDTAVVVPLLVAKIAESKRKKGAEKVIGNAVYGWFLRKRYKEKRAAAALAQHRMRTLKARREYQKWSKERQERLKREAAERTKKEAEEKAMREAEAEARRKAEAEASANKKKADEKAVAAAVAKAKAEAEARVAAEMAEAEARVAAEMAENEARNAAKQKLDRKRSDSNVFGSQPMVEATLASPRGRAGSTTRRPSFFDAASNANLTEALTEAQKEKEAEKVAGGGIDGTMSLEKASSNHAVKKEEYFDVLIIRDVGKGTLGIAVDLWDGEVTVGAITTGGPADREGTLVQGDVIKGVDGCPCNTIEEVTGMVQKAPKDIRLSICRRPVSVVLESMIRMRMPSGEWEPFAFRLLSNRNIEFEKLSPPVYAGEIHARLAQSLKLVEERGGDKVLEIVTGHKHFQIKCETMLELETWQLRLQEVIMLQEKVANVAHGWLLKEEPAQSGSGTQFKHYWFVLFSNGILMYFADMQRAVLGQALGFIPVENCVEETRNASMHTISIKCSFKTWLLATKSKESMLQWAASLKVAAPSDASAKPAIDAVLAQGWCDLPRDTPEGEVWARHWFVLKSSALQIYPEEQKKAAAKGPLGEPSASLQSTAMKTATRAQGADFYKWGIVVETTDGTLLRMRATGQSEMRHLLSTLNVNCIPTEVAAPGTREAVATLTEQLKAGYLYKRAETRKAKPWGQRWFVLEVMTDAGPEEGTVVRTGQLTYFNNSKDAAIKKSPTVIHLKDATKVQTALGKTHKTEHRVLLSTPDRESGLMELGHGDKEVADDWAKLLQFWIGPPKVAQGSIGGEAKVVRSAWMEVKWEAHRAAELTDDDLARSETISKSSPSFARSFFRKKKEEAEPATKPSRASVEASPPPLGADGTEGAEDAGADEEQTFAWAYVALLSEPGSGGGLTLRQYTDEAMTTEVGRLQLGYRVQAAVLDDPIEDYETAFRVVPDGKASDTWLLCPGSDAASADWIATIMPSA